MVDIYNVLKVHFNLHMASFFVMNTSELSVY